MIEDPFGRPTFAPAIFYRDPRAMVDWLAGAFGFEAAMVITDEEGAVSHAELKFGDGYIMVGGEWAAWAKSPASIGGANSQAVHVHLKESVDDHCARARAAGATIAMEPEDQFYGDRVYRALDPEGHSWTFAQPVRRVSREDAEKASGLTIDGWPDI